MCIQLDNNKKLKTKNDYEETITITGHATADDGKCR